MKKEIRNRNIAMHLDMLAQLRLRAQMAEAHGFDEIARRARRSMQRHEAELEKLRNAPSI